jgi:hypothetical protein
VRVAARAHFPGAALTPHPVSISMQRSHALQLTSQQGVSFVRRELLAHGDPDKAARSLVDFAIDNRKSMDNVSAIVVLLKQ